MSRLSSRTSRRTNRKLTSRQSSARKHYLESLEPRQLLSGTTSNAPAVETFYLPFPAASVLQALQTIHAGPQGPVSTYTSIAVAEDGTNIFYDQWENGYAADITNPTASEVYNSVTNPAGVQIWGDGDPSNGSAPGFPSDVLHAGDVISLQSPAIAVPRDPSQIYFDGGDKIAVTKSVAIGILNYASGTATKLAGALQVNPTNQWGTNYQVPIGQNTVNRDAMFNYTGLSITAAKDGTTIQIDMDGNGTMDKTITLDQGQAYLVNNGVKQGATVVSTDPSKPIQVDVITGTPTETYASRWFDLAPVDQWSNSYYTPVSTKSANATAVFLYNPSATAITVTQTTRGSAGAAATLTSTTISVPAKGSARVTLLAGSGAHFITTGGQAFYAVSTTDLGGSNYDWGMSLISENQLTTQAIVGLGYGRDPTSTVNPTENGSPVWVTPVGNGNTAETVYVDFNGDDMGPLTDPNGYHYDEALSLKELQQAKIFDPDGNQSGMLVYTLNPNVKLAVSWGEDPATASAAFPGIDAGTNITPLPEFDAGKSASLLVDANGDGLVSPGDTLLYTIVVNNIGRPTLADLNLIDNLPADLTYIPNTTSYTITPHDGVAGSPVMISDAGSTAFPLDEAGDSVPALMGGATYTVTFQARIASTLPAGDTIVINTGSVTSSSLHENVPLESDTPVNFDVSGLVFQDTNRDGTPEAGEPGLAGVTVNLLSGTTVVATTTTDASGHYLFIGAPLGTDTVDVVDSSVLAVLPSSEQTAGLNPSSVVVNGGGAIIDAGIDGYMTKISAIPSSLTGHVTVNGVGLGGVAMTLTGTNAQGPITPLTILTAADGSYSFTVLTGTYTISEAQPSGYVDGPDSAGTFGGTVAPVPGDQISAIPLPGASVGANYNFTELNPASVTGSVYADANNNGIKDSGEAPISGVLLTLAGSNDLGVIAPITVTTAADGSYSFGMLRPGTYTVTETQPAAYLDGKDAKAGVVIIGSNTTDVIGGIVVASGSSGAANTFGELLAGSAGGFVYADANNNGAKDAGEAPIGGVLLTLTGNNDFGVITPMTVTTAADGSYSFGSLRPGTYTITETQPAGYMDGKDAVGSLGGTLGNDVVSNIVVASGAAGKNYNFGELLAGNVGGFVYTDANNNGIKDAGETPISGVLLTLTGTNDLGTITPVTLTTGADGSYSFGNLRPGTYTITETQPAGFLDGLDAKGGMVITGSSTTDVIGGVVLSANSNALNNIFGELVAGTASGSVYVDANNNGIKDAGEAPISGVVLTLTGSNDLGVIAPITVTTATDGSYSFGNLRPGTYTITEAQPIGYFDGKDAKAGVVIAGSNTTDVIGGNVTNSGTNLVNNTFGELPAGSTTGFVYVDANNNGIRDAGEAPIGGVTLTLTGTNDLGTITPITITTAADGSYSFGSLRPGTYTITETQPAGYLDGKDAKSGVVIAGSSATDLISGVTVNTGSNASGNTFGELVAGSTSGFVYVDANNNGAKDAGEAPIAGVILTLTGTNDLGTIAPITATTAADGSYSFGTLRPGVYTITETQPAGFLDGKDAKAGVVITASNTTDSIGSITLTSGSSAANNLFGELLPASLKGSVYSDANNNGAKDAGEAAISGVVVTLTGSNDLGTITAVTVTTAADGSYSFGNLRPGTYTITETQPAGYADGKDAAGTLGGTVGNDIISAIVVNSGNAGINYNFGEALDSISGIVYRDLTGNGASADDTPQAGVTVNLYRDDGDQVRDAADVLVGTATSAAGTGAYSFTGLPKGFYFAEEVVPTGWVRTGPATVGYYANDLTGTTTTITNDNFTNFQICDCKDDITCLNFVINGCTTVSSLAGNVHQGDTVRVNFTINSTDMFSLVSYTAPDPTFVADHSMQQVIFDSDSHTFGPGTHSLTVVVPNSYYQIDFVCGMPLSILGPAGSNIYYTPQGRLISSDNGGTTPPAALATPNGTGSISGSVYVDSNNDAKKGSGEAGIAGLKITLTGVTTTGLKVKVSVITDASGNYTFSSLAAGTYKISEGSLEGHQDGKDTAGTKGGIVTNDVISNIVLGNGINATGYLFGEH